MQKLAYMLRNMPDEPLQQEQAGNQASQQQKPDLGILRRDLGLR